MDKCCFCGKEVDYKINGNDPRPIKIADKKTPVCCNECNAKIVIPTRQSIWHIESENFLLREELSLLRKKVVQEIKDKISDGLYRNSYGETFIDGDIYEILDQIERNGNDNK